VTGAPFVGGGDPPEPPAGLPAAVALERAGALDVPDVFPDVGDVVALGVVCVGDVEPLVDGAGLEGVLEPTTGAGDVETETDVGGNGELVDTVALDGVVEASTVTGPMVAATDADGTASVAADTSPADACGAAISDTLPDAHRHTRTNRERACTARLESVRLTIPEWKVRLNIPG
jgi:hypothetical protein